MLHEMERYEDQFGNKNSNGSNFKNVHYVRNLKFYMQDFNIIDLRKWIKAS